MSAAPTPTIVGAGLAGLIAAHAWPAAPILEATPQPRAAHRALLRFRTEAVARLTGVEFRRVTVRKGIWADGGFQHPAIRWANLYARKVLGRLAGERSIWNLETAERFIAPMNFYEQLIDAVGHRIQWNTPANFEANKLLISTAPLPFVLQALGIPEPVKFDKSSIRVARWKISGADVFQTVYFPEPWLNVYRASITGDLLIVESVDDLDEGDEQELERAFGLRLTDCQPLDKVEQRYGKIAPIDDAVRKQLLFKLTHERNIYSLGRFATWRNILLDDVVDDIAVVKRLLKANNAYDLKKASA